MLDNFYKKKLRKHKIRVSTLSLVNLSLLNRNLRDFSLVVHVDYHWRPTIETCSFLLSFVFVFLIIFGILAYSQT
jgi:hypothetical protein